MQTEQKKALIVGFLTAFICSIMVSAAVVLLRPIQQVSKEKEKVYTITSAAGFDESYDIAELFKEFKPVIVTLNTGEYKDAESPDTWDNNFSKMIRELDTTDPLDKRQDIVSIKRVPKEMMAYVLYRDDKPVIAVLPVYGSGLWSVMFAYLAIDVRDMTVAGIRFYQHGETPGLGGEIDNLRWQTSWKGKRVYNYEGLPHFVFSKNPLRADSEDYQYAVDALSGATLTTDGVKNIVYFWLGDVGYRNFLNKLNGEAK